MNTGIAYVDGAGSTALRKASGPPPGTPDNTIDVHLVRHGETSTYEADSGLTPRGRRQAVEKGESLARSLPAQSRIWLPHAPTSRAAETAEVLRVTLLRNGLDVGGTCPDPLFDNFRVWCDGRALDPAEAYPVYRQMRDTIGAGQRPGWYTELDRYLSARSDDPVGYWLTSPLQHFEPAASTVRRLWRGISAAARRAPLGTRVIVSTHSGCLRAVAASAFGADVGKPHHLDEVRIRWRPPGRRALVIYRAGSVDVEVPDRCAPPWFTDRWLGHVPEPVDSVGRR